MKKNIISFATLMITAFGGGLISSCSEDFLEVKNPTGEPLEEYYTTDERLNEALTSAYAPLHWPDWDNAAYNDLTVDAEIMGDDFWVGGSNNTDNEHWHKLFNFEANGNYTLATLWGDFYSGIKRCNDAIKYCSWGGGTEANRRSIDAQARVLRVYYYSILWHYYGNVPFYLENLSMPYTAPQLTADEIYDQLLPELEEIIASNVLPMRWDNANAGRVSQAMAYMLYAELVMYQNDTARYPKALSLMKEIIASPEYQLNPDYADLWEESGEWCAESIFEINYNDDQAQRDWGWAALNAGGSVFPTLCSPNQWPGGDGWSGMEGWGFLPVRVEAYDKFSEGDLRRDATILDFRFLEGLEESQSYHPRYQNTFLWLKKYSKVTGTNSHAAFDNNLNFNNNYRYYRYSETLLNAAELVLETGGNAATAAQYVSLVRQRAGLNAVTSVTKDDIIDERDLEFMGEGKRYWDLVRTGKAATVLVPDQYGYRTNRWTENKKYIPIAQGELDSDPALVQNEY